MTGTKTYSIRKVTDCRDCPGSKLTSSKEAPYLAMMCTVPPVAFVIDGADYTAGRCPTTCPLDGGDVMLTRDA